MAKILKYSTSCRTKRLSVQNKKPDDKHIDLTVFNFIKSLKILKHRKISLTHISRSLKLPTKDVEDSIQRLQKYGLKIRKI